MYWGIERSIKFYIELLERSNKAKDYIKKLGIFNANLVGLDTEIVA